MIGCPSYLILALRFRLIMTTLGWISSMHVIFFFLANTLLAKNVVFNFILNG
jgi:hypothetical protein